MAKNNNSISSPTNPKQLNSLPSELLGQSICKLSVVDRLHCERVSPRWKWLVRNFGWTDQRKLDRHTMFEGLPGEEHTYDRYYQKFWHTSTFIPLFNRIIGPNLMELDLQSFGSHQLQKFVPEIVPLLQQKCFNLQKLNIIGFNMTDFANFLPSTLCTVQLCGKLSLEMVEKISQRCPNLEEVSFHRLDPSPTLDSLNALIGKFLRQRKLDLDFFKHQSKEEQQNDDDRTTLSLLPKLQQLEELSLWNCEGIDDKILEQISKHCTRLRRIRLWDTRPMKTDSLFHLAAMPNLTVLEVYGDKTGAFSDSVLKAIACRGQLKRLKAGSDALTDESIVFLISKCKSLVSLNLFYCSKITERSLEAVLAEIHRRHGKPPGTLPSGPEDNGIFFFDFIYTEIDKERAREMTAENPWLTINTYDSRNIV